MAGHLNICSRVRGATNCTSGDISSAAGMAAWGCLSYNSRQTVWVVSCECPSERHHKATDTNFARRHHTGRDPPGSASDRGASPPGPWRARPPLFWSIYLDHPGLACTTLVPRTSPRRPTSMGQEAAPSSSVPCDVRPVENTRSALQGGVELGCCWIERAM